MDFDPTPFNASEAWISWLRLVGVLSLCAIGLSFILAVARNGSRGVTIFAEGLKGFLSDLTSLNPRRIFALASLTFKDAVRRKALLVFVVFIALLMFAGWFISDSTGRPELQVKKHIALVLTSIAWLTLPVVIYLSCWVIPEDIGLRSMHTVVTKPVRRIEIVVGRILGFSSVATLVLGLMGLIGYGWILRQVPAEVQSHLTCRVPVFGQLYFIDPAGQPSRTGINVGDPWMFRSFVQGNSRARAVWVFRNMTPETVGDELTLESRFEAFRTVKGSESSIKSGMEAQYVLVKNPREEAFGGLAIGATFRDFADALREGQFNNAAERANELAEKIRTSPREIPEQDYGGLFFGSGAANQVLDALATQDAGKPGAESISALSGKFLKLSETVSALSKAQESAGNAPFLSVADDLASIAETLSADAELLRERLPRLEVPLPTFNVAEFHAGDNVSKIPRRIQFTADYETLSRFLSSRVEALNAEGKLVSGDALSAELESSLEQGGPMSPENARLLATVLNEQLSAGELVIADGKLSPSQNRRWLTFFDTLVQKEMLVSQDIEGWKLELDLFNDLTTMNNLRVEVACVNDQMYLGMARPDLFVRLPDRSFRVGYFKSILTLCLMMLLVVVIGVTASCVVKGPVSVFLTLTIFILGQFFHGMMDRISGGKEAGLGLVESATLIFQHRNPNAGMDASESTQNFVRSLDSVSNGLVKGANSIVPDFGIFQSSATYVENGFDVPFDSAVLPSIAAFLAFLIPCILLAGACLKFRELEAK
ncbi:MAG: hypothetical protein JNL58_20905 [Planctomyces sp.]|nr:hypothetical protein [Planctomyces sp.]